MIETSPGLLRKSLAIFGNVREMFGNVRVTFGQILENLRRSSERNRKSSENRQKRRHQYLFYCSFTKNIHSFVFKFVSLWLIYSH